MKAPFILLLITSISFGTLAQKEEPQQPSQHSPEFSGDLTPGDYIQRAGKRKNAALFTGLVGNGAALFVITTQADERNPEYMPAYAIGGISTLVAIGLQIGSNSDLVKAGQIMNQQKVGFGLTQQGNLGMTLNF